MGHMSFAHQIITFQVLYIFKDLDGVSLSPDSFLDPIGKKLNGLVSDWHV